MTPAPVRDVIVSVWLGPLMLGLGFVTVQGLWAEGMAPAQQWKGVAPLRGGAWKTVGRPVAEDWKERS